MQHEYVFHVKDANAERLETVTLADAAFLERKHLQEWIIGNPEVLGEDALIVTSEFDRWQTAAGDGRRYRLDVLAIDSGGQLIVAELKRDASHKDVELQALKYAALVSRFDEDTLTDAHRDYLSKRSDEEISADDARESIKQHLGGTIDSDGWTQPKVVLIAGDFPETVTNTVIWLSEAGLEIVLLGYQMYRWGDDTFLVVSQTYPPPDTEDLLLSPRREEVRQARERNRDRRRRRESVKILIEAGDLTEGEQLNLVPSGINRELKEQLDGWIAEDPTRGQATWTGDSTAPIKWQHNGETGAPSGFAKHILQEATGEVRELNGNEWWQTTAGESLATLAKRHGQ